MMRRLLCRLVLLLLSALIIPGVAFPGLSQVQDVIAFQKFEDGNWDLWLVNADGSGLRRLTNNPAQDKLPCWSPDGTKIAFVSDRDGNTEIYTVDVATGVETRLTENQAAESNPAWSPDGTRIAFASWRDGKRSEIYVMNADGSAQTRLTFNDNQDDYPVWSPDGNRIAFTSSKTVAIIFGSIWIMVMNADGSGIIKLDKGRDAATWSPDGQRIAYVDFYSDIPPEGSAAASTHAAQVGKYMNKIYIKRADGKGWPKLFSKALEQRAVRWSPAGDKICYVSVNTIRIKNADGRGKTIQLGTQALAQWGLIGLLAKDSTSFYDCPSWSPDGSRIAYALKKLLSLKEAFYAICTVKSDGQDNTVIVSDTKALFKNPVWAPRGIEQ